MSETLEHVPDINTLRKLAVVNQDVFSILDNRGFSRKRAVAMLEDAGFQVSEKLVRTWRVNNKSLFQVATDYIQETYNSPNMPLSPVSDYSQGAQIIEFKMHKPKARTIVVMPDVQAPLHDERLVNKFIQFLGDFQPNELAQVGDFTDSTEISRWVRGRKKEYAGDLKAGFKSAKEILNSIRENFDGRLRIVRSNHDDRLELYIESCAPGLESFMDDELSIERLAGFKDYDVEFVRDEVVELAHGWVMAHGDEGSLSPVAGRTAFGLAKNKFGVSTVCGHTHRAGMTSESTGYNGKIRNTLTGLEVGHFMDMTKADYLKKKGVAMNWQQAFGILHIHGDKVYPQLITVNDGNFSVEGVLY